MKKMFSPRCCDKRHTPGQPASAGGALAQGLPEKWDDEADVVVVGYGAAGAAAAAEAHDAGADIILLEKLAFPAGMRSFAAVPFTAQGPRSERNWGSTIRLSRWPSTMSRSSPGSTSPSLSR